jgi:MOSC domain-containing protein
MSVIGHVESVWRYPVKSMRGEKLERAFVGFSGVYGDRLYAFQSSAAAAGFPFLTARQCERRRCKSKFSGCPGCVSLGA